MKNIFLHPTVLKKREESLIAEENRLQMEAYCLSVREDILKRREREIKIRSRALGILCAALFSAGFILGVYFPA